MKFGIIYYGTYPSNRGIDQLAQSLRVLGHDPVIVAKSLDMRGQESIVNGVRVIHVPPQGLKALARVKSFHIPFNLFWRHWLIEIGKEYRLDGIIVRETPLSWAVLGAAKKLRIPAYLDMRENLAAMYKSGKAKNLVFALMRYHLFVRLYEQLNIPRFDRIFTVSLELKEWVIRTYGLPLHKVAVLENTPSELFLKILNAALAKVSPPQRFARLVYAGWIAENKGIGEIINALPLVLAVRPNIQLRIIGDGDYLEHIKAMVDCQGLNEIVEFMPMLCMRDLACALAESHVGIECSLLNELTHQTVPGKLFEYMAAGLAVLSSPRRPVIRIVNEIGCGAFYESFDKNAIAHAILQLLADDGRMREMGRKARDAVLTRYSWRSTLETLRSTIGP